MSAGKRAADSAAESDEDETEVVKADVHQFQKGWSVLSLLPNALPRPRLWKGGIASVRERWVIVVVQPGFFGFQTNWHRSGTNATVFASSTAQRKRCARCALASVVQSSENVFWADLHAPPP